MDIHNSNRIVMLDKDDEVFYENTNNTSWVTLDNISHNFLIKSPTILLLIKNQKI